MRSSFFNDKVNPVMGCGCEWVLMGGNHENLQHICTITPLSNQHLAIVTGVVTCFSSRAPHTLAVDPGDEHMNAHLTLTAHDVVWGGGGPSEGGQVRTLAQHMMNVPENKVMRADEGFFIVGDNVRIGYGLRIYGSYMY
jgi:hypothetical protein